MYSDKRKGVDWLGRVREWFSTNENINEGGETEDDDAKVAWYYRGWAMWVTFLLFMALPVWQCFVVLSAWFWQVWAAPGSSRRKRIGLSVVVAFFAWSVWDGSADASRCADFAGYYTGSYRNVPASLIDRGVSVNIYKDCQFRFVADEFGSIDALTGDANKSGNNLNLSYDELGGGEIEAAISGERITWTEEVANYQAKAVLTLEDAHD